MNPDVLRARQPRRTRLRRARQSQSQVARHCEDLPGAGHDAGTVHRGVGGRGVTSDSDSLSHGMPKYP
jgi:hypothetical protein